MAHPLKFPEMEAQLDWAHEMQKKRRSDAVPFVPLIAGWGWLISTGALKPDFISFVAVGNRELFWRLQHTVRNKFDHAKRAKTTEANRRPANKAKRSAYYRKRLLTDESYRKEKNAIGIARFHRLKNEIYAYRNNRRKTDPQFRISSNIRTYIYQRVGGKNTTGQSRFKKLIGCSIADFLKHLESHWEAGMSWHNYGKGDGKWSIDHTLPCRFFDLTNADELAKCFHFSNMKPMWWEENLRKSDKLGGVSVRVS